MASVAEWDGAGEVAVAGAGAIVVDDYDYAVAVDGDCVVYVAVAMLDAHKFRASR